MGVEATRPAFLLDILDLEVGTPVSIKDMQAGAQRLANTGLFNDIQISEDPAPEGTVALVLSMEEAKTGTQRLGVSYSSLYGASVTLGVEERNWRGLGLYAGASLDLAETRQQLRLFYQDPRFDDPRGSDQQFVFFSEVTFTQDIQDALDYRQLSSQISTSLTQEISDQERQSISLVLGFTQIFDAGPDASDLARAAVGKTDRSLSLAYTRRADFTQTDIIPYTGTRWDYSASLVTSNTAEPYIKFGTGRAWYGRLKLPEDADENARRTVLSARGSADFVLNPLGDLGVQGRYFDPKIRVRGFAPGGMAPRGAGSAAIGGTTALGGSLQATYEVIKSEQFPLFAQLFMDAGTVFDQGRAFTLNTTTYQDARRLRWAAGIGLALGTPAGTLVISQSRILSKASFDQVEEVQFSIGTQF